MVKNIFIFIIGGLIGAGLMHHFGACQPNKPIIKDHSNQIASI